jgi:hypothetical protein
MFLIVSSINVITKLLIILLRNYHLQQRVQPTNVRRHPVRQPQVILYVDIAQEDLKQLFMTFFRR